MNIAVLVSGGGTNLQALIDAEGRGELAPGKVTLVISSRRDAYALERARRGGIEAMPLRTRDFSDTDAFDRAMEAVLLERGIGLVVLGGYLSLLGPRVVRAFENRIVNVHPALIPAFSGKGFYGLRVHEAVLRRGVKITGATVHLVNEEYDSGPILLQKAVEVMPGDTPELLQQRVMREAEWELLPRAVGMLCRGEFNVLQGAGTAINNQQ